MSNLALGAKLELKVAGRPFGSSGYQSVLPDVLRSAIGTDLGRDGESVFSAGDQSRLDVVPCLR